MDTEKARRISTGLFAFRDFLNGGGGERLSIVRHYMGGTARSAAVATERTDDVTTALVSPKFPDRAFLIPEFHESSLRS